MVPRNRLPESILAFGALCDGVTDDSAAILAAEASGKRISIPNGMICYGATIAQSAISAVFTGPGQIKTSDGNLRGPIVSQIGAANAPVRLGSANIVQAFNGDLSRMPMAVEHRVGAGVLPAPATAAYSFENELASWFTSDYFAGGGDTAVGGNYNAHRTGYGSVIIDLTNAGQGDASAMFVSDTCAGPNAGSLPIVGQVSFLQGPACQILGGAVYATAPGTYLQGIGDINLNDSGNDVAAIGMVVNLDRTVNGNILGNTWIGYRAQANAASSGTPPDAAFSMSGPWKLGFDAVDALAGGTTAAIVMGATQRVYWNAVQSSGTPFPNSTLSLGTEWQTFGATNGHEFDVAGAPVAIFGGSTNRTSIGKGHSNSGSGSVAIGGYNTVTGSYGTALGGANQSSGANSTVTGLEANDHANQAATCSAGGIFAVIGDAQQCTYVLRASTSGATGVRLTADGLGTANGTNCIVLQPNTLVEMDMHIVARDVTTPTAWSTWRVGQAVMDRAGAGAAVYTAGAAPTQLSSGVGSGATLTLAADTTNSCLAATFTAPPGNTDTWHVLLTARDAEAS
jgi:hypothetical protein